MLKINFKIKPNKRENERKSKVAFALSSSFYNDELNQNNKKDGED